MIKRIGIRYCGGCNPRYDRAAAVRHLQWEFPQHEWGSAGSPEKQDLYLLVCGCETACASADDLGGVPLIRIRSDMDLPRIREFLRAD